MDVYFESLDHIRPIIRNQLIKLNNRWNGRMLDNLLNHPSSHTRLIKDARVFYCLGSDSRVKSWAMLYRDEGHDGKWHNIVDFYTKKSERKKGYATAIAAAIRVKYPKLKIYGSRERSTIFKRHHIIGD